MIYTFEDFELDTSQFELRQSGEIRKLDRLTFSLLTYLVSNHARVVSKDDINTEVWDGRIVSEAALSSCMHAARAAINDSGKEQRLIKTVHGQGFRFVGKLKTDAPAPPVQSSVTMSEFNPPKHSIAVLPFDNMSDDPEQDYFADGMCEDIITVLAKIWGLDVTARNSSFAYKGQSIDVQAAGRELNVRYILEGSVRRVGDRVRITGQLIDTLTGVHKWAERYDRNYKDIFALQDEMTREIVSALQISLTAGDSAREFSRGTSIYQAWENMIHARYLLISNEKSNLRRAQILLEDALKLDNEYVAAHAALGRCHWQQLFNGWSNDNVASLASVKSCVDRAYALDTNHIETLSLLGFFNVAIKNFDEAQIHIDKGLLLAPTHEWMLMAAGCLEFYRNQFEEATKYWERGLHYSAEFNINFYGALAWAHFLMNNFVKAREKANAALAIDENYIGSLTALAMICAETNKATEAKEITDRILHLYPTHSMSALGLIANFQDPKIVQRISQAWTKAGLPD